MYNLVPFKSFKLKKKAWRLPATAWLGQKWPEGLSKKARCILESRSFFSFLKGDDEVFSYYLLTT
jgi:hypothetical protein